MVCSCSRARSCMLSDDVHAVEADTNRVSTLREISPWKIGHRLLECMKRRSTALGVLLYRVAFHVVRYMRLLI